MFCNLHILENLAWLFLAEALKLLRISFIEGDSEFGVPQRCTNFLKLAKICAKYGNVTLPSIRSLF